MRKVVVITIIVLLSMFLIAGYEKDVFMLEAEAQGANVSSITSAGIAEGNQKETQDENLIITNAAVTGSAIQGNSIVTGSAIQGNLIVTGSAIQGKNPIVTGSAIQGKNPIVTGSAIQGKNSSVTGITTNRVIDPKKPMVALTFDDGPHAKYTLRILETLKKYNGRATFFLIGNLAAKNKSVVKAIYTNGNQIGNHTYDHKNLTKLNSTAIKNEITKTDNIIKGITNETTKIMRPTYGSVNNNVKATVKLPMITWSIDTLDWKSRNKDKVVKAALSKVKDGDIILMHDIYKSTADAAEVIIKELNKRGYQLVTIEELYSARGTKLIGGKVYSSAYNKK